LKGGDPPPPCPLSPIAGKGEGAGEGGAGSPAPYGGRGLGEGVRKEERVFQGKRVIALGDRDGIQGPAIAACLQTAGADVAYMQTECFV
jgi:glycine/sarcosine/betaine reductase complex component A